MKVIIFSIINLLPVSILAQTTERYSLIISELFPDPSPSNGLPPFEFVELKNISASPISLNGWSITDGVSTAYIAKNFVIQPDSFVIICPVSAQPAYSAYGNSIGVISFPSLNNDADTITLKSAEGKTIHAVAYKISWYHNEIKTEGGWTLEMKDFSHPCMGEENWSVSVAPKGGTPGIENSIEDKTEDGPPHLVQAYATDSININLIFDKPLDSLPATLQANYTINNGAEISSVIVLPPLFQTISVKISKPLLPGKVYELSAKNINGCMGSAEMTSATIKTGLPLIALQSSLVINEILFNPGPGESDYVEFYNRSENIFDAAKIFIANRSSSGSINSPSRLSTTSRLIFPGEYLVVTEQPSSVAQQYVVKDLSAIAEVTRLPSFPDDKGDVVLLNDQGEIIDELLYDEKWQFALINNRENVALERIDPAQPTQNSHNWHSASSDAGYGTPGYINSQFKSQSDVRGEITANPLTFSPDNDGFDDILTINYRFPDPGYVCNITVFDASGRPVRYLVRNNLCGSKGYYRWDGLNEKNQKLPVGIYILLSEVFNLEGKTKKFKQAVILARKL